MKKILLVAFLVVIIPVALSAQSNKGYSVIAYINGLKDGNKMVMKLESEYLGGTWTPLDSGVAKNGTVNIKGIVPEGPRWYRLTFENNRFISLFISNGENVSVKTDLDIYDFNHISNLEITDFCQVDGSPSNSSWHNIISGYYVYFLTKSRMSDYLKSLKNSVGFDTAMIHSILVCRNQLNLMMYGMLLDKRHLAPTTPSLKIASLAYANQIFNSNIPHDSIFVEMYNGLDENEKGSYYGKLLKDKINLCVGQPFPGFSLPMQDGKIVNLKDITSKGKLTIVNFWSSVTETMVMRKQYQDELRAMYKLYHDKGLNIVGVSADDSSTEYSYKKILRQESFPWPNVCDLQGRNGVVEKVYKEYGPEEENGPRNITNYLIDSSGKIVAYDLTGLELQYFIWKYTKDVNIIASDNNDKSDNKLSKN